MKKIFIALSLISAAAISYAAGPDTNWSVSADSGQIYTLLPQTITLITGDTPFVTAAIEVYEDAKAEPSRLRIAVTGCAGTDKTGRIIVTTLSGNPIDGKSYKNNDYEWVDGGGRVYDILAISVCIVSARQNTAPNKQMTARKIPLV